MQTLRNMLNTQELVVGLMVERVTSPWLAKVYSDAGADFVYVENEHLFFNQADLSDLILSCRLCGLPVVAKSSYVDRGNICKLLDAGVTGIQLPMSETADQLRQVVSYTKFPPLGVRAAAPGSGNTCYESVNIEAWLKRSNEETIVIAHIESLVGIENVDEILQVPEVDLMFIGTCDLSVSLGHPGQYNHRTVKENIDLLFGAAKEHGKIAGMWCPSYEQAEPWIERGVRFFETTGDVGFIAQGAADLMKQFPGHQPRGDEGQRHT